MSTGAGSCSPWTGSRNSDFISTRSSSRERRRRRERIHTEKRRNGEKEGVIPFPPYAPLTMLQITGTIAIDDREIEERFVRASGPGGQNVNKVSTAVELRFDVRASSLPFDVKQRVMTLAGKRMTSDGVLLIDSREHRTQAQNRDAARARLVALVEHAAVRPKK